MAKWKFGIGEFFETITKGEMRDVLRDHQADIDQRAAAQGKNTRG